MSLPDYEAFFTVKQPEEIRRDAMDQLQSDLNKQEGSFSSDMASPLALELHKVYEALRKIKPMVWVDETSGPYLDLAAEDLGIEARKPGSRALVDLKIQATPGTRIPKGSVFLARETLSFVTQKEGILPSEGVILLPAQAMEVGKIYNVAPGEITQRQRGDLGTEKVQNPKGAQGGADPESDASLFARIDFARKRPATSGNKHHYEMWAREVDGVGAARVFALWKGNGTVKVLIADDKRQPVDPKVVERCAAYIEEQRPTTARVTVLSAQGIQVDLSVEIQPEGVPDDQGRKALIRRLRQSLEGYFEELSLREYRVSYHRTGAMIIGTQGVADYRNLSLNGLGEDLPLTPDQVPILGEVAVTWI